MAEDKYKRKNPIVKRILQEVREMQSNPSDDFMSLPLEENIFEWQFAIRGPQDTKFEGRIYHGRIQLPSENPFKPPSFMLLTPSGRFDTQTKICLSISTHHPEDWQPSWSVRTALVALIAFMPTNPNGALGSLDYTKEEKRALAIKSREAPPKFGSPERQKLIYEIHEYMLSKVPPVPQGGQGSNKQLGNEEKDSSGSPQNSAVKGAKEELLDPIVGNEMVEEVAEERNGTLSNATPAEASQSMPSVLTLELKFYKQDPRISKQDRLFTWANVGLTVAIVVLLLKKFMKANGYGAVFMNES